MDKDDVMRRAMAAYFRSGTDLDQPSARDSGVEECEGLHYAVLRGGPGDGTLAVYRVRSDGMLKRLKRWPAAIAEGGGSPTQAEIDAVDFIDPLARVHELHALNRPLTAAENEEVQHILTVVQESVRQMKQLVKTARKAVAEARVQEAAEKKGRPATE